jgi:hypothetical protein
MADIAVPLVFLGLVGTGVLSLYLLAKIGRKKPKSRTPRAQRLPSFTTGEVSAKSPAQTPRVVQGNAEPGVQVSFAPTRTTMRREVEDERDAWEGSFWEAQDVKDIRAKLKFDYTDSNGLKSRRTAQIRQMGSLWDGPIVIGHCLLRDETRTFRPARMARCVDVDTGKSADDVNAYLLAKYAADPQRLNERLREEEVDTLKVLYFIGKADGQFREDEKRIIRATAKQLVDDSRLTDDMIDRVLFDLGLPSLQGFKLAVGRLAKRGEGALPRVLAAAEQMIATQKTIAPAEAEALAYLRKRSAP